MSLFGVLNTGRTGIFVSQHGLATTGNNIANVNTPGYSRQRLMQAARTTGGVQSLGVERLGDVFFAARLRESNTRMGGLQTLSLNLQQLETALGDTDGSGFSKATEQFFAALQDLSVTPGGPAEREAVRSRGSQLVASLRGLGGQIREQRQQLDAQLRQQVEQINTLARNLADVNRRLDDAGPGADEARNALLDQRDQIVNQLSNFLPVRTLEDAGGKLTVFVGDEVLVEGLATRALQLTPNPANDGLHDLAVIDAAGNVRAMRKAPTEGSLGALLRARDEFAGKALADVERLAGRLIQSFNAIHRQGVGLDGGGGRDFFAGLDVTAAPDGRNRGGVGVAATAISDADLLTFDDYEIRFTSADAYEVVNTRTNAVVTSGPYVAGGTIQFDGMSVELNGPAGPQAGDVIHVDSYRGTSRRMALAPEVAASLEAIAAGGTDAAGDNTQALLLAALRDQLTMGSPPTQTFDGYFGAIRLQVALATESSLGGVEDEAVTQQQLVTLQQSVAGVSLDEEATNIIQYQRAFEASSRVIRIADELIETVLQIV
ncbi:MAG TPA: flagellar hook-associated protein FlgK [Candidatus Sumerlaeota bacterium]|nr:flagellar hook-associated protein FlgK [Candidatus Sumerlaeota bacterium]